MMTLAPCWQQAEFLRILKPDAEEIDDRVFRAVHCPTELQVSDSASGALMARSPEELVKTFLDPNRNYVQMAVIGQSGTGKSHLIQWLRLHIPQDPATVMLTIPRTGTSLRGIIERIINQLPAEERGPYQERLRSAGNHAMTQAAKVTRFLDALAHAIEHGNTSTDPDDVDLASVLPSIFHDPNLRAEFFTKPGETTDLIVRHIFSDPSSRDYDEQKREFSKGDLPLDGQSYLRAAQMTRDAIDYIKLENGMEQRAIDMMNAHRNVAIAQTLNFSADHLIELMNTLRRHLARQGKRLILLIEDFARVQGIDTALLQALITPPSQGDERLCELRWAMAVTTGPYKLIEATVRTRATIVVDMDRSAPSSLERLTAGYLNALRLGMAKLEQVPATEAPASHCGTCPYRQSCHAAFGAVDDIGLFPFTHTAINTMARRTGSVHTDGKFNARHYMQSVLEGVLKHHYTDLAQGEFPSSELVRRIGGSGVLTPAQKQTIQQRDSVSAERRIALLELWNGKAEIVNLDAGIHAAFGVSVLNDVGTSTVVDDVTPTDPSVERSKAASLPKYVDELHKWANEEKVLTSPAVTELRGLVYGALESYIDWDMLGMERTAVTHATATKAAFRQACINFVPQQTQPLPTMVTLNIERADALALEALLSYKHHQHWDVTDGMQLLTNLMAALARWAEHVQQQLRSLFGASKEWHPVGAAAELLVLAHYLCGKVKLETDIDALAIQIWGRPQLDPASYASPTLKRIADKLVDKVPVLHAFLRAHASGTKGGRAGNFVRMAPVLAAVRSLRVRGLQFNATPPEKSDSGEVQTLIDLYRLVQEGLPAAVDDERRARSAWYQNLVQSLGANGKLSTLIGSLRDVINDVVGQGINTGNTRNQLQDSLSAARPQLFDFALGHGAAIETANLGETLVRTTSIGEHAEAMTQLLTRADNFMRAVNESIDSRYREWEQKAGAGLADSEARIATALEDIVHAFDVVAQLPRNDYESA